MHGFSAFAPDLNFLLSMLMFFVGLEQYQKSYPMSNIIGSCQYQYPMPIPILASCHVSCYS